MNWPTIIIVSILVIALIVFTIKRNQIDEKDFENSMKDDFPKKSDSDIEVDEKEL